MFPPFFKVSPNSYKLQTLQKEQDFIEQSDASSSLRRKDENGQIIISTLSNIIYDVDQDVDSEDEELNQSRLDMKRIVGDSVRFSGGGSSNSSSRNKKENSVPSTSKNNTIVRT